MIAIYESLGFHSFNTTLSLFLNKGWATHEDRTEEADERARSEIKELNLHKVFGYCPLAGIYTGVKRIEKIKLQNAPSNLRQLVTDIMEYVRAFFEILGLGLIFLPLDLAASGYRFFVEELHPHALLPLGSRAENLSPLPRELESDPDLFCKRIN